MTEKKKIKNIYKYKYIWNIFFYLFFYFIYLFIFLLLFSGTQLRICVQVATPLDLGEPLSTECNQLIWRSKLTAKLKGLQKENTREYNTVQ